MRDVASAAGVSVGTVSKVLNNTGTIAKATRERVIEVARSMNFRPNSLAKSLHTGLSGSIGLISNDSFGRFTMPIMEGLEAVLAEHAIGVFMSNATDDPELEQRHIDQLLAKQVDGIVVTARRADRRPPVDLRGVGIPVVYVFSNAEDRDALTLLPDDEGGGKLAVDHLVAQGRKRIAHVTGPQDFVAVSLRASGYLAALEDAGLDAMPVMHGPWSEAWGREAASQLLDRGEVPDAVLCGNDQIGRGCVEAFRDAGHRVPEDIAIIGFDNWPVMTDACRPPLSSVDLQLTELGQEAGRRLLAMIGGERQTGTIRLPCRLELRGSTERAALP
ncbi:LacI family transcriptional regulator [Pelagovum pacificum]|uniref:LacI family transcriptional regulator n=1 Tax=Pelagovum pacificum TaxID=2588711 RepID=A0A5C5GA88_9RHOB|nr:LacI family DNA-binding transcriptional regulator [Pelagovum pacificum]TNY31695.1 LacI family transcriptional regulator [Pelagovum pacificum]